LHIDDKELLVYDSLGHTQYSCAEALRRWILDRNEITTRWEDIRITYVPEKVCSSRIYYKLKYYFMP